MLWELVSLLVCYLEIGKSTKQRLAQIRIFKKFLICPSLKLMVILVTWIAKVGRLAHAGNTLQKR